MLKFSTNMPVFLFFSLRLDAD